MHRKSFKKGRFGLPGSPLGVLVMLATSLLFGACGGGSDGDDGGRTYTALGEARRAAVLYRLIRDSTNVALPYLRSSAELQEMDGTTVACLAAGTATRTYNPGSQTGVEQFLQVQFDNCVEAFGTVAGSITIMWGAGSDRPENGSFQPIWFGTFSIDGVSYNVVRPSSITLSYNATSGYRSAQITVRQNSGIQAPASPALATSAVSFRVIDDPNSPTYQLAEVLVQVKNVFPEAIAEWRSQAPVQVSRAAMSEAAAGLEYPQIGGFSYSRLERGGTLEPVVGTGQIDSGLLTIAVEGLASRDPDSGQFDWPSLLASALFNMEGQ